jgi:hypothetical protein
MRQNDQWHGHYPRDNKTMIPDPLDYFGLVAPQKGY